MLKHVVTMIGCNYISRTCIATDHTVIINNGMDASGAQFNIKILKIFTHTCTHTSNVMSPDFEVRLSIIEKLPVHEAGSDNRSSVKCLCYDIHNKVFLESTQSIFVS